MHQLPLDTFKIDQSFVKRMIAEGVETVEQLAFQEKELCDFVQGYLISPPVPAYEFFDLIEQGGD